jgi:hypothetical protein
MGFAHSWALEPLAPSARSTFTWPGASMFDIYGKAVLYFLARPPIRAFRLGEARVTGCSDTF